MTSPARLAALEALAAARRTGSYVAPQVERAARAHGLSGPDHALAVLLAKGVTRTMGTLDEALGAFTRLEKLEPQVRDALRLAAFELLFLRTPPHAAVDEAVSSVRRRRPQAAGLANAVLRRLAEKAPSFPWGDPAADPGARARAAGCPRWLADRLVEELGQPAADESLAALSSEPPVYARIDVLRAGREEVLRSLDAEGAKATSAPPDDLALRALDPAALAQSDTLQSGAVFVADAGAQFAALQAAVMGTTRFAEVGAGRGTKTLTVLGKLSAVGPLPAVLAVEPNAARARQLRERLERSGVCDLDVIVADVQSLPPDSLSEPRVQADVVLVDAPCTGTGTLRRHPEAVWRITPEDAERLSVLQREILAASARLVRPGGLLVYSTCSVLTAENESVVRAFLDSPIGEGFAAAALEPPPPSGWERFVTSDGFFRSWPTPDGPDGHFVARFRRMA